MAVVAILVPEGEQSFRYAGLHLVRGVLPGNHGRRVWLQRRTGLSRGRGGVDQKPNGSRLSSDEQLAHFFAGGGSEQVRGGSRSKIGSGPKMKTNLGTVDRCVVEDVKRTGGDKRAASAVEVELLRLPRRSVGWA